MTVKIYSLPSDAMSPPVAEGFVTDFVLASDYAELQRKVEALAVENIQFRDAINAVNATAEECELNGDELKYVVEPSEFDLLTGLLDGTPATDAAIAEIEARGVDRFASELGVAYQVLRQGSPQAQALKSVVIRAATFSSQLRKEPGQ